MNMDSPIDRKNVFYKYRILIACLLLVITTLLVYRQVTSHVFVNYDDTIYVTNNRFVTSGLNFDSITWAFTIADKEGTYWQPLTWLSHILDYELYGLRPAGHHLTSLILHTVNTLLVFLVLYRMTKAFWESVLVAALFGLHPINVESAVWVAARKNVLSTLFWILTMAAYVFYTARPCLARYLLTFLILAAGLMAKPMLATLPFVLLLLDYWPLGRLRFEPLVDGSIENPRKVNIFGYHVSPEFCLMLEKVPLLVLSFASIRITLLSLQPYGNVIPTKFMPMSLRISNALVSYVGYIGKMIWPRNLSILYPYPGELPVWQTAGAGLFVICVSVLVLRAFRQRPYLLVGWLWYLGTLVPAIGLVQGGVWPKMADRFAYVPFIGLYIMIVWGAADVLAAKHYAKVVSAVLTGVLLPALMVCSWLQVRHWQNSMTLFRHTLNVTQNNVIAHFQLGLALEQKGKLDEAIRQYSKALQLAPNYAAAHTNLGAVLVHKGDIKGAVYHYYEALKKNPYDAGAYNNLGNILFGMGRTREAILAYREALRWHPDMPQSLYSLAWIKATHSNEAFRDGEEAIKLAERLCQITNYNKPLFLDALAAAYAEAGRFSEAVKTARQGLDLVWQSGPKELVPGIKERLKLYQNGRPYR